nr:hypothetical protein K-LCC10_0222 [Kaumoebavirus]
MESEVLLGVLPNEIVAMIDDELCKLYRKENSRKIFEVFDISKPREGSISFNAGNGKTYLGWESCHFCYEILAYRIYNWKQQDFTLKKSPAFCKCKF